MSEHRRGLHDVGLDGADGIIHDELHTHGCRKVIDRIKPGIRSRTSEPLREIGMNESQAIGMLEQKRLDVRKSSRGKVVDDIDTMAELQKVSHQV